jgi:NCS1 family nucleobase:cation symporter-1
LLPSWWGTYGWFFGVAIGGVVYFALASMRPRVMPVVKLGT